MPKETGRKLIAQNRKARHDYLIEDTYEAGLVLTGTEVKSLRAGRASLVDGFADIEDDEIWLLNVHIPSETAVRVRDRSCTVGGVRDAGLPVNQRGSAVSGSDR